MKKFSNIIYYGLALLLLFQYSCTDDSEIVVEEQEEQPIKAGEKIQFVARMPQPARTRMSVDEYNELINTFKIVQDDYHFTVEMLEEGTDSPIATGQFDPTTTANGGEATYDTVGTLSETDKVFYWQSNVKKYAFHAYANKTENIEVDQTSPEKLFAQDYIEGYGYPKAWDQMAELGLGGSKYDLNGPNYLTSKDWYALNKSLGSPSGMTQAECVEYWKKIPLYLHHRRSMITVKLMAGEGVDPEQLMLRDETDDHLMTTIFSYDDDNNPTEIKPLLSSYECDYTPGISDDPENTIQTAQYDAIVNPHDYAKGNNISDQKILQVNLSNMNFSFYAANDKNIETDLDGVKMRYNLEEGKHLILTVVLSTDTRKILITAYVVDWEEKYFSTICDDFGQAGKPEKIENKQDLLNFLVDNTKNKSGKVAMIIPTVLDLGEWVEDKDNDYVLNATIKLAGATIKTNNRLVKSISSSGGFVNGTILLGDNGATNTVDCAIAEDNYGTIDRIKVVNSVNSGIKATRAGLVVNNYGKIYACSSTLPVFNEGGSEEIFIGGIAAQTLFRRDAGNKPDLSTQPMIGQCTVNARVDGGANVKGGGIVGKAEGQVQSNVFEYGITLLQVVERFKNILHTQGSQVLEATYNEWPTHDGNAVVGASDLVNARSADLYTKVIDSQEELGSLMSDNKNYNTATKRFRIADSFTVSDRRQVGENTIIIWDQGFHSDDLSGSNKGNLFCELNGNNKTITLTGDTYAPMLFSNIMNKVYDLTVVLEKPIVALPNSEGQTSAEKLPSRAPLAYSVTSSLGQLSNIMIKSKSGSYVQASSPSGLVVWAYNNAVIDNCQSNVDVRIALPENSGNQQIFFVGGLVANAATATISRCIYHCQSFDGSQKSIDDNVYYGGIVGGTEGKSSTVDANPLLLIVDCTSWLSWSLTNETEKKYTSRGGIIGYSKYQDINSEMVSGMSSDCQGNWWQAPEGASSKGKLSSLTEDKVIGKKNSVNPVVDSNYNK